MKDKLLNSGISSANSMVYRPAKLEVKMKLRDAIRTLFEEDPQFDHIAFSLQRALLGMELPADPPKKCSADPFEFCARAVSTDPCRESLHHVYCDEGKYIATDNRRLHMADIPKGAEKEEGELDGVFLNIKTRKPVDPEGLKFPNYKQVIPIERDYKEAQASAVITMNKKTQEHTLVTLIDNHGENNVYLDYAFYMDAMAGCSRAITSDCLSPVVFKGQGRYAVVMPMRMS